ncbi:MAG TPA: hypothetical protein VID29_01645 [Solirubrobacteraceae bacterium]|jgi:hypothetical protein
MSSMSKYLEAKVLGHIVHKAEYPMPEPWLALCTVVPTSSSTGSTITEATYAGYRRVKVSGAAAWHAAVEGSPGTIKTAEVVKFAACTAGSSIIKAVALCDAETTGNMLWWAEVPEFTVSTTQTPAEAAAEAIEATLS